MGMMNDDAMMVIVVIMVAIKMVAMPAGVCRAGRRRNSDKTDESGECHRPEFA